MPSLIVMKMTDAQKEAILSAEPGAIDCVVERRGDLFEGLVNVYRAPGLYGTVARTGAVYNDGEEAMDVARDVVNEIQDTVLNPEDVEEQLDAQADVVEKMIDEAIERDIAMAMPCCGSGLPEALPEDETAEVTCVCGEVSQVFQIVEYSRTLTPNR